MRPACAQNIPRNASKLSETQFLSSLSLAILKGGHRKGDVRTSSSLELMRMRISTSCAAIRSQCYNNLPNQWQVYCERE